ncbi:NACHT and TPR [Aspergillus sclerotialis]|uniref:NACHT and TPR n=1 Tax=Aspergillus sclerotialis TaxID=2070753 RepID=A0A3A2ZR96_9EURO|nr:NACHT and TPR [Aspergillus sclerotialis]
MDTYSSSSEGTLIGVIRQLASSHLAQAFLCNTLEAGAGTPEAEESVTKLERLVHQSESYYPLRSCAFVPAVYLGMYHRLRGQEEQARAFFQPALQQIVQTIGDNNPSNEELSDLKYTLARAGDIKNVIALAHRSDEDSSDGKYICCGPCKRKALIRDGFSICPICIEGELCPDCVKLFGSAIQRKRCHSQHVKYFISIPPLSKEINTGGMLVDGVEIDFETWLNQLKNEWVLNAHNPPGSTAGQFGISNFFLGFVA